MSPRIVLGGGLMLNCVIFAGCRSHTTERVETRSEQVSVRREASSVDSLIVDIQSAPTPQAEADALHRLRKYEVDNGLTYTLKTFRTADNAPVEVASIQGQPVRAEVTLYRGREVVRTFYFIPKDNRNMAVMGQ